MKKFDYMIINKLMSSCRYKVSVEFMTCFVFYFNGD